MAAPVAVVLVQVGLVVAVVGVLRLRLSRYAHVSGMPHVCRDRVAAARRNAPRLTVLGLTLACLGLLLAVVE